MSKQFWSFLLIGLAVVGIAVAWIWSGTKPNHLVIESKVLGVRAAPIGDGRELIIMNFRVTNPTAVPLVIRDINMQVELYGQPPLKGLEVSRSDVGTMFQLHPLLGGKDYDVLADGDSIGPGQTLYRMAEASFEASASAIAARKQVLLEIEDVDGGSFEIPEKPELSEKPDNSGKAEPQK